MMSTSEPQTITYKKVGQLHLLLDLTLPPNAHKVPVLLWFHGGGLLYVLLTIGHSLSLDN
jgi:carboxylesterase type B